MNKLFGFVVDPDLHGRKSRVSQGQIFTWVNSTVVVTFDTKTGYGLHNVCRDGEGGEALIGGSIMYLHIRKLFTTDLSCMSLALKCIIQDFPIFLLFQTLF